MKKLANLSAMALLFIATLAFATSCSKTSPATEYAQVIEKYADLIEKANSMEELQSIDLDSNKDIEKFKDSDYELTSADKDLIKDAMAKMLKVVLEKSSQLSGQELPAGTLEMATNYMNQMIDSCKTLGELQNIGGGL